MLQKLHSIHSLLNCLLLFDLDSFHEHNGNIFLHRTVATLLDRAIVHPLDNVLAMGDFSKAGVGVAGIPVFRLSARTVDFAVVLGGDVKIGSTGSSRIPSGVFFVLKIGGILLEEDRV